MKRVCAVTSLARNAKQGTPLSHSKPVTCDKEAPRLVGRRPACGNGAHAPGRREAPAPHGARLRPTAALAVSRGPPGQTRASPTGCSQNRRHTGAWSRGPACGDATVQVCQSHVDSVRRVSRCRAAGSHPSTKRLEPAPPSTRRCVARLAKVLDICCNERLASTHSDCNALVFHYVTHS